MKNNRLTKLNTFLVIALTVMGMMLGSYIVTDLAEINYKLGMQPYFGEGLLQAKRAELGMVIEQRDFAYFMGAQLATNYNALEGYFKQAVIANYELRQINEENYNTMLQFKGNFGIVRREIISFLSDTNDMDMFELWESWPHFRKYLVEVYQLNETEKEIWGLE